MPRRRKSSGKSFQVASDMQPKWGSVKWARRLVDVYREELESVALPWWDHVEDLYESRQFADIGWNRPDSMGGRLIEPPRVLSIVHATDAYVFNSSPKLFFEARMAETEQLAEVLEDAENAEWRRDFARRQPDNRIIIRDASKCGWGIGLTTFETDFAKAEADRKRRMKKLKRSLGDPTLSLLTDQEIVKEYRANVGDDDDYGYSSTIENDDRVMTGCGSTRRIPPRQFLCDVNAVAPKKSDAQWMGRYFYVYKENLVNSTLYKNTSNITPSTPGEDRHDDGRPVIKIYELFFKQPDGSWDMRCFAEGGEDWIRKEKRPYIGGNPYTILSWNETGNRLFPISDIQPVYGHIMEEINFRTRLYDAYMRECQDFSIADGTVLTEKDIAGIANYPVVGAILRVAKLGGRPLDSVLQRIKKDPKTPELMNYLAIIEKNIQDGTGMGPNQSMQALKSDTSASEARIIEQMHQSRAAAKVFATNEFMAETALKSAQIKAQFYTPNQMGRLAGPRGEAMWSTTRFTDAQIRDGLAVTVEEGSMQPQSDERRAQLYGTMIQEAFTFPVAAATWNVLECQRRRARSFGVHDGSALINPKATPGDIAQVSMNMAVNGAQQKGSAPRQAGQSNAEIQAS